MQLTLVRADPSTLRSMAYILKLKNISVQVQPQLYKVEK